MLISLHKRFKARGEKQALGKLVKETPDLSTAEGKKRK